MLPSSYQMNKILIVLLLFITSTFNAQSNETDWLTYFEKSNYLKTPNYDSTIAYFQKISDYTDQANLMTFGFSPQGRELKCMIAAKEKAAYLLETLGKSLGDVMSITEIEDDRNYWSPPSLTSNNIN